jgi:hypothetical protein
MNSRPPLYLFNWPSNVGGALPAPSPWGEGWGEGVPTENPALMKNPKGHALTLALSPGRGNRRLREFERFVTNFKFLLK